mmetsp:Transcript_16233/g.19724  ORF Transcript_16233/g.19724 Transcript_16233/m.19724 type:complete len:148 (+) Transcript_16233:1449-1892(+)
MQLSVVAKMLQFGGVWTRYKHMSKTLGCEMIFAVYLPPDITETKCLKWLSGLTCTDLNFVEKAGAARHAAKRGIALVLPDTSPRGSDVPNDENYDLGQGAGFYLDATQMPWSTNYKMESYVTQELVDLIDKEIPEIDISEGFAISGK